MLQMKPASCSLSQRRASEDTLLLEQTDLCSMPTLAMAPTVPAREAYGEAGSEEAAGQEGGSVPASTAFGHTEPFSGPPLEPVLGQELRLCNGLFR